MKFTRLISMSLAFVAFLAACSSSGVDARKVIAAYNEAVIQAHRTGDISKLTEVADAREARAIAVTVDTKRSAGLVLEATLESLEIEAVKKGSEKDMTVETKERWRYFDRRLAPGASPGPVISADMKMRYICALQDGRWKVAQIETIANNVKK